MAYDILAISAHPDDAEVKMGGTLVALTDQGQRVLLVDLCDGEPSDFATPVCARSRLAAPPRTWAEQLFPKKMVLGALMGARSKVTA